MPTAEPTPPQSPLGSEWDMSSPSSAASEEETAEAEAEQHNQTCIVHPCVDAGNESITVLHPTTLSFKPVDLHTMASNFKDRHTDDSSKHHAQEVARTSFDQQCYPPIDEWAPEDIRFTVIIPHRDESTPRSTDLTQEHFKTSGVDLHDTAGVVQSVTLEADQYIGPEVLNQTERQAFTACAQTFDPADSDVKWALSHITMEVGGWRTLFPAHVKRYAGEAFHPDEEAAWTFKPQRQS